MDYKDYYKVMGLNKDATDKDIKTAYRRLARKYHPDLNKEADAEEKFKELGEAYEVLKDAEKRKTYDQYTHDVEMNRQNRASEQSRPFEDVNHNFQNEGDFFEFLFGQREFNNRSPRADLQSTVTISLEEAYHGVTKDLQVQTQSSMPANTLRVKIPAGVKSGQQIRLTGQGGHSSTHRGDLYLTINIAKHSIFDLKGNDIYISLPVTPWEVALGCTIQVPTIAGKVDLKIPSGAQGGQTLRLKGRGFPGKITGDQYVILKMVTPKPSTETARTLYKTMSEEMPFNPRANMGE